MNNGYSSLHLVVILALILSFGCSSDFLEDPSLNPGTIEDPNDPSDPTNPNDPDAPNDPSNPKNSARLFLSGHSLVDNPLPDFIEDIAQKKGDSFMYNQQNIPGSPLRIRTIGDSYNNTDWPGYRTGKNRSGSGMNIISEFLNPMTLGAGERYDTLVITDRHDILEVIRWEDTIGFSRHYHDRFIAGNPNGQSYLYHSWLDIDKSAPAEWIDAETKLLRAWHCVVSKVNHSLESDSRNDRMKVLPAGAALAHFVELVLEDGVTGITGSTSAKLNQIFSDNVHLTDLGVYYIALVSYSSIFGKTPSGVTPPSGINPSTASALQNIAWNYISNFYSGSNSTDPTMSQCRTDFQNYVCEAFLTLRPGGDLNSCRNAFGDSNSIFRWPDPDYEPWPAP